MSSGASVVRARENTSRAIRLTRDLVTDPPAVRPNPVINRPTVPSLGAAYIVHGPREARCPNRLIAPVVTLDLVGWVTLTPLGGVDPWLAAA
jgi:hypothetical protein